MKKLFISQPMEEKTDKEILKEREIAIESAEKHPGEPVEVIDSFFKNAPADARPLWFPGKSLELLSTSDVAFRDREGKYVPDRAAGTGEVEKSIKIRRGIFGCTRLQLH